MPERERGGVQSGALQPCAFRQERFGEISAANFGLAGRGFLIEAEALAWLRESV
ncbi:MAG: hypothetical protein ACMG5Z_05215 [Luteimonas sp.]